MTHQYPLDTLWENLGASFEQLPEGKVPLHFSSPDQEYHAAQTQSVLFDLSRRGKIRVTGADRLLVLHRLLTQDLKSLGEGREARAAFLTAQGKIIGEMNVYILAGRIILDLEAGLEQKMRAALERFIITEDVVLHAEGAESAHLSLWGPEVPAVLKKIFGADTAQMLDQQTLETPAGILIIKKKLLKRSCHEIIIPREDARNVADRLLDAGVSPAGETVYEMLRIEEGLLRYGRDMDETVTLPETGLDKTAASDTKGCYPGQEVVARTNTYQGHAKKMVRMEWCGLKVPAAGEKIYSGDCEAGWITSACALPDRDGGYALAYLLKPYFQQSGPFKSQTAVLHKKS